MTTDPTCSRLLMPPAPSVAPYMTRDGVYFGMRLMCEACWTTFTAKNGVTDYCVGELGQPVRCGDWVEYQGEGEDQQFFQTDPPPERAGPWPVNTNALTMGPGFTFAQMSRRWSTPRPAELDDRDRHQ